MSCNLDRPTTAELFDRTKKAFSANVLGGYGVIPESNEWYLVSNDAAMADEFYTIAEQQWRSRDPRYACCDDLYAMAARKGVYPRPAGFSQGYAKVTGPEGTVVPNPLLITFGSYTFRAISFESTVVPASGSVIVRLKSTVPGADANAAPQGVTGVVQNTTTGLDSDAEAFGSAFCGGSIAETCEQFRARYIDRESFKPKATMSWLMEKLLEWPCVTRVAHRDGNCCVYPGASGPDCGCNTCTSKLEFYPLFDDTFDCGIPPECVVNDMNDWLFGNPPGRGLGQVEIGVCGKLYAPVASLTNVRIGGLACASPAQVAKIRERITDLFRRAVPSEMLTVRSAEVLVSQIMGESDDYTVAYETVSGEMSYTACGDLNPPCDVMPCLNEIIIVNPAISQNCT